MSRVLSALVLAVFLPETGRAGAAQGTVAITDDLSVAPLCDGVWVHTSWHVLESSGVRYPANGLLVREGDGLVLVDTAWGERPTADLLDWVQRELKLPVVRAIISHAHDDRMGGAPILRERGIPFFAQPMTVALAADSGGEGMDAIDSVSQAGDSAQIGDLEVFLPGAAHTRDNIVVWIPRAKVLFGGCAVKSADVRGLGNIADADVPAWPGSMRRMQERYRDADTRVVPGHGDVGGLDLIQHTLDLLEAND